MSTRLLFVLRAWWSEFWHGPLCDLCGERHRTTDLFDLKYMLCRMRQDAFVRLERQRAVDADPHLAPRRLLGGSDAD